MARKTKEEALATRSAILDAAEIVFEEHGVSRTSLAEIAAAAGVTRGAVYWHFANKFDLFDAMVQRVVDPMETKLAELQTRRCDDPVEMLRELTRHFLDRVAHDPRYSRVIGICWHKCEYVGEMATVRNRHFERCRQLAFRLSSERGFHKVSVGLMAIVDGLVANWTLDRSTFSLTETGDEIVDSYLAGWRASRTRETRKVKSPRCR